MNGGCTLRSGPAQLANTIPASRSSVIRRGSEPRSFHSLWAWGLTIMTSLKKIATTVAVTAGLLASNAALFASSAQAGDYGWRRHGGHHRPYAAYNHGRHQYAPARRDRTGDAVGAAVLGIGALIIGAAIADAARNKRRAYHD